MGLLLAPEEMREALDKRAATERERFIMIAQAQLDKLAEMQPDEMSDLIGRLIRLLLEGLPLEAITTPILALITAQKEQARKEGRIEVLTLYAWWKDGIQYVGTTGTTLREALQEMDGK